MNKRSTCTMEGCGRRLDCKGLCGTHYKNMRKTGRADRPCPGCGVDMVVIGVSAAYCSEACRPSCRIEWCENPTTGQRDVCQSHYASIRARGREPRYGLQRHQECVVCGRTEWPENGLKRYCSRACARVLERSGGVVVREVACVSCGTEVPLFNAEGMRSRKVRADRTRCSSCSREPNAMTALALAARDGGDCSICSAPVDFSEAWPGPASPSVDHVVPLSKGGLNAPENLALAHLTCNRAKSNTIGWLAPA